MIRHFYLLVLVLLPFVASFAQNPTDSLSRKKKDLKPYLNFWVLVQTDVIYDLNKMDPEWTSYFRPSKIPVRPGDPGWNDTDGNLFFSVKPSTFKFEGVVPLKNKSFPLKLRFEFDLIGLGPYRNQTGVRFRLVYADWGHFRVGKDWSTFIDLSNFPNIYDWWGPSGMALLPDVMFRYTGKISSRNIVDIALELPGSSLDFGDIRSENPMLDTVLENANFTTKEQIPDLVLRYTHLWNTGHFKIMSLLRSLEYDHPVVGSTDPVLDRLFGWGINMSLQQQLLGGKLKLQGVFGRGYAAYNNDGGVDIAPVLHDDPQTPGVVEYMATVPFQYGFTAFYDYRIAKRWSGSFGFSETHYDVTDGQSYNAFNHSEYVVLQTIYSVFEDRFLIGLNYQYGHKYEKDGTDGFDQRLLLNFTYLFKSVHDE